MALGLALSPQPMILAQQYVISTYAGNTTATALGDGAAANAAQLLTPTGLAIDASGNLYIVENSGHRIRQVQAGTISTKAGNGNAGFAGDGATATNGQLNYARSIAVDPQGNLYIADTNNFRVRKVAGGTITTLAGTGFSGSYGDGGAAGGAGLLRPRAVAANASSEVFIADAHRIRKVSTNGNISTIAGDDNAGYVGDGGPAVFARLNNPLGLAVDTQGNLYIADSFNQRIRKISANGVITTVAGNGTYGYSGDGGPAISAQLSGPTAVAVDASGSLYITEFSRVRKVLPNGTIITLAGSTASGYWGDGQLSTQSLLDNPNGVAVDANGSVFVADSTNNLVRVIQPTALSIFAVTHGASGLGGPIAPGEIITLYGAGIGPNSLVKATPSQGVIGTSLANVQVTIGGVAAPVLYASTAQVGAVVPYAVNGTTVAIQVQVGSQTTAGLPAAVAPSAPGIFSANGSGTGQAASLNADGSVNSAQNPAAAGSVIVLYATGEGVTGNPVDGQLATNPLPVPLLPVSVTIGGIPANVVYAGGAPGQVAGLMQVNVQIPGGLPAGDALVVLTVGTASTPAAITVAVRGS